MKKRILSTVMLVAFTTAIFAANSAANQIDNRVVVSYLEDGSCTVEYINSNGVKFTATAETCDEAYENIMPHIEAR